MEPIAALNAQLQGYWIGFLTLLPQLGVAIIVLVLTWALASFAGRIARAALNTARLRRALVDLVQTLLAALIWIFGLLLAATIVFPSITPSQLLGALGVGGIAVGLAFRDIFENFMAGIMIMARKPMRIGDTIEVNDIIGRVEEITMRDTYVRKLSNELVLLPNSVLFKNPVDVLTDSDTRRYEIIVGVAYGADAAIARDVIQQSVEQVEGLDRDQEVEVYAREFGSSSIDFTVRWWAKSTMQQMHETRSHVVLSIKAALDDADIEIPFPYRTLTFAEPLRIETSAPTDPAT